MAKIPRIAAAYRGIDQEELQAELAVTLLHLRQKRTRGIRNWKSYVVKSLLNRASKLVKRWRRQREVEIGVDQTFEESAVPHQLATGDQPGFLSADAATEFDHIRRRISRRSLAFLRLLAECDGSISGLARKLGQHRNTVGRRLRKIRELMRSVEIVSKTRLISGGEPSLPRPKPTERRVLIIQALIDGRTYREIEKMFGVSHPTISRWRQRFEETGPAGLLSKSKGSSPSTRRLSFEAWMRKAGESASGVPLSKLAKRFGLGKTTVHRIIKAMRR